MIRFAATTTALLISTTAAFAGPVEVPPPPPPVYVEPERCSQPFECFYLGAEVGLGMGSGTEQDNGVATTVPTPTDLDYDGSVYGVFAGYNFQNGNTIFGGEVRYLHMNLADDNTGFEVNSVLDLRGRVGFAAGDQFMIYGAAGYSMAEATAASDFDMTGFNYGVGAEFNVSESFFLGADVTGRQLEGTLGAFDYEGTVNTATIRAGFRF